MSTMTPNIRRKSGDLDVYTGLLLAAFLVLVAGVVALYTSNTRQVDGLSQMNTQNVLFGVPGFEMIQD